MRKDAHVKCARCAKVRRMRKGAHTNAPRCAKVRTECAKDAQRCAKVRTRCTHDAHTNERTPGAFFAPSGAFFAPSTKKCDSRPYRSPSFAPLVRGEHPPWRRWALNFKIEARCVHVLFQLFFRSENRSETCSEN